MVWDIIAAFFAAALSGMGVGGGGLFIIYLVFACDAAQRQAQYCNLVFFIAASAASLVIHAYKRKINMPAVLLLGAGGVAGSFIGCGISAAIDGGILRFIFGGFLICCGLPALFSGGGKNKDAVKSAEKC